MVVAIASEIVIARASSNDGSGAEGLLEITIKSRFSEPLYVIVDE